MLYAMNQDEAAHERFYDIIEAIFHFFIVRNKYYFAVHTFMSQGMDKILVEKGIHLLINKSIRYQGRK